MSPEQARAEKIDGRSDLFSLGTVLLELLTLKPAFAGESDIDSLMQVQQGKPKDWEQCKAKIPEDVLPVVLKAMAADRNERYANGAELAEACELVLRKRDPGYGSAKLATYIEALFVKEHTQLRERMHRYEHTAIPETVTGTGTGSGSGSSIPTGATPLTPTPTPSSPPTGVSFGKNVPVTRSDLPPEVSAVGTNISPGSMIAQVQAAQKPRSTMYLMGAVVVAVCVAVVAVVFKGRIGTTGAAGPAMAMPTPTAVSPVGTPSPNSPNPATPPATPPPAPSVKTGRLLLTTNTAGTKVFLDKSPLEKSTSPVAAGGTSFRVDVPAGIDWTLRIEAEGFSPVSLPIKILPGEETSLPIVLPPVGAVSAQQPVLRRSGGGGGGGGGGGRRAGGSSSGSGEKSGGNESLINPF
jgi:serine/threonine-protein kinase